MTFAMENLPGADRDELEKALVLLRNNGANEIYLFGSMARGDVRDGSDWDIAVRGIPPEKYFRVLGEMLSSMNRPVDLIDLDGDGAFAEHILKKKEFTRVA